MKKKIALILLVILAVVLPLSPVFAEKQSGKYFCPMHPHFTSDKPGDCPICHMRLVPSKVEGLVPMETQEGSLSPEDPKAVCLMHDCPMEKNGKPCPMLVIAEKGEKLECPFCKTHLAGKEMPAGEKVPAGYATVLISPQKQQLIGIKTGVVERKSTQKTIRASGRIAYDPELYQTQAEYLQSLSATKAASPPRILAESADASSGEDWAKKMLESTRVKLVRMGFNDAMITELEKQEEPDKSLLYAVPDGPAWVYASIYEYELPLVKVGDLVRVEVSSDPGLVVEGTIRAIDSTVDSATRTVRVRALVKNGKGVFKPDMYVNLSLLVSLGEVMTVPVEAVFFTGAANIVFVGRGNGLFEPREVILGQRVENSYEVKKGLNVGEQVVVNGNFLVDSESRLKAALSGFGSHQHGS